MNTSIKWGIRILGCLWCVAIAVHADSNPEQYTIEWDTPSADHKGSVPLGNGSTGLNAWIEPNGDLIFYISRTDSWGDDSNLFKVGKVRILLDPKPSMKSFSQTLRLVDGTLTARCGKTDIQLWVDANHSVIHATIKSPEPVEARAEIELWRTENPVFPFPDEKAKFLDTLLPGQTGRIGWYHRNMSSKEPAACAINQGVQDFKRLDPLLHRTFGVMILSKGAKAMSDSALVSSKSKTHQFDLYVHTEHPATEASWLKGMNALIAEINALDFNRRLLAHKAWWTGFWERSWIHASSKPTSAETLNDGALVSRGYALQRYINACGGRGAYPIKFNGSIFTVPPQPKENLKKNQKDKDKNNPDYRRWGARYWWQNTRLPYYSMCTSGDVEFTEALYQLYCRDLFDYMKHMTKKHTGHGGIYMPETMLFWGDRSVGVYGKTPYAKRGDDKLQKNEWHKYEWVSGLELSFLMFERYEFTEDETFLQETLIPFAHEILTFFDLQYQTDSTGKLLMHPAQACELYWKCTNPMPEIAGLHAVSDRLLALPKRLTTSAQRTYWQAVKNKVPALPTRVYKGKTMLAAAGTFEAFNNREAPEFYATFPFRHIAVGKPNIELGIEALPYLKQEIKGWRQNDIQMAYLGQTDQAKDYIITRVKSIDEHSRFPGFWGPNYDWTPDQCHGGVIMKTFQSMLMQTDGKKIYLMPAWPKDWDAEFKLHAPYKTTVEGTVKNGKLIQLNVVPASRKKDVVILPVR